MESRPTPVVVLYRIRTLILQDVGLRVTVVQMYATSWSTRNDDLKNKAEERKEIGKNHDNLSGETKMW